MLVWAGEYYKVRSSGEMSAISEVVSDPVGDGVSVGLVADEYDAPCVTSSNYCPEGNYADVVTMYDVNVATACAVF